MALPSSSVTLTDLTNKLVLGERFSCGGFAVVYKGQLSSSVEYLNRTVAVKLPDLYRKFARDANDCAQDRAKALERWEREIRAGQSVAHPNILPFLGFCRNLDPNYHDFVGIVLPFCANGNANAFIKRCPNVDRMYILSGVAAAVYALHSACDPVVHGDIKAVCFLMMQENILIDDDENPRLADFGLSRICEVKGFTTQIVKGTCRWMAVELIRGESDSIRTTKASDIWAFAMTILEILSGRLPFNEIPSELQFIVKLASESIRPQKPPGDCIPNTLWEVLKCCWNEDASKRPDVAHIGLVLDLMNGGCIGKLDVPTVVAIVDGAFDAACAPPCSTHLASQPYKCKWPSCCESFGNLDDLIAHECDEFRSRSSRAL